MVTKEKTRSVIESSGAQRPKATLASSAVMETEVGTVSSTSEFAALEEEWDELYESCPSATPFQSWAWLYSWWQAYGDEDYSLKILTVRLECGLLVGILPLMLKRRLLWIGTGEGNVLDMLIREGFEKQVYEDFGRAIQEIDSWWTADLQNLRSDSLAWGLVRALSGPVIRVSQEGSPVMDVRTWEDTLSLMSSKRRSSARGSLRKLEADGVKVEKAQAREAEAAARRLVALHRESWRDRNIATEHQSEQWESYIAASARRLTERGLGSVSEFRIGDEVLVSQFLVHGNGYTGGFLGGATQKARKRYQVMAALIRDGMETAASNNAASFDLMQGEDAHKLPWTSKVEPVYRMIIGKNVPVWLPYAGYRLARVGLKRLLYAESTPQWARSSYGWLCDLPWRSKDKLKRLTYRTERRP